MLCDQRLAVAQSRRHRAITTRCMATTGGCGCGALRRSDPSSTGGPMYLNAADERGPGVAVTRVRGHDSPITPPMGAAHCGRGMRQKGCPAGSAYTRDPPLRARAAGRPNASTRGSAASTSSTMTSKWICCGRLQPRHRAPRRPLRARIPHRGDVLVRHMGADLPLRLLNELFQLRKEGIDHPRPARWRSRHRPPPLALGDIPCDGVMGAATPVRRRPATTPSGHTPPECS